MQENAYIYILFLCIQSIHYYAGSQDKNPVWVKKEGMDCYNRNGAVEIGPEPHSYSMSLDICKAACMIDSSCEGIIRNTVDQQNNGRCYLRKNLNLQDCKTATIYTLYYIHTGGAKRTRKDGRSTQRCTTIDGPATGENCVKEFTYKGQSYSGCTTTHGGRPWCSTKVNSYGEHVGGHTPAKWGYCSWVCDIDTSVCTSDDDEYISGSPCECQDVAKCPAGKICSSGQCLDVWVNHTKKDCHETNGLMKPHQGDRVTLDVCKMRCIQRFKCMAVKFGTTFTDENICYLYSNDLDATKCDDSDRYNLYLRKEAWLKYDDKSCKNSIRTLEKRVFLGECQEECLKNISCTAIKMTTSSSDNKRDFCDVYVEDLRIKQCSDAFGTTIYTKKQAWYKFSDTECLKLNGLMSFPPLNEYYTLSECKMMCLKSNECQAIGRQDSRRKRKCYLFSKDLNILDCINYPGWSIYLKETVHMNPALRTTDKVPT